MKKVLGILLALMLVLAFSLPVMATDVDTGVTISSGGGAPPIIKCKWEQDTTACLEEGDTEHKMYPGGFIESPCHAQFLPSCEFDVDTVVEYWAIITDPDDVDQNDAIISVDVFHPLGPPENGSAKYQLTLELVEKGLLYDAAGNVIGCTPGMGVDKFMKAWEANLVTVGTNPIGGGAYTKEDIKYELEKCTAKIYMVEGFLEYHQPYGNYKVEIKAIDQHGNHATPLENCMTYVAMQAMRIDFTDVSYGEIMLCKEIWITGDTVFETPGPAPPVKPTVHNIGNMPLQIKIKQDDMGFGYTGIASTTYQGLVLPDDTQSSWNVIFDARVGSDPAGTRYFDPCCVKTADLSACTAVEVTLPTKLMPCNPQELDLSIHVRKADVGAYSGNLILVCVEAGWDP
ncbi:MAG TPA: hypothetical protein VMW37_05330 [Dehalococcoidales bacterium]|nr:hypothetical protein [Dehalococcoidales bacterium]